MNKNKNYTINQTFTLAIQNHQKNNIQVAKNLYIEVLKIDSNHTNSLNNLGLIFKSLKNYKKAISFFEKAIEIDPNYVIAHYNLANIFQSLKQFQNAISSYNKTIEIDPKYLNAYNNLAHIFLSLKQFQKAIDCYEKAIEVDPNYEETYYNLGIVFDKLGDYQKSVNSYEKVIKINSHHTFAHNNLGIMFDKLGDYQKAINCYKIAIEINPNNTEAYYNLGKAFYVLKEDQKAIECFEKAIKINPNYAHAHNNLGIIFNKLCYSQKAIECFEKAIKINPNYALAHNNLGIAFDNLNKSQKAIECFEKAIKIFPGFSEAKWNLHGNASNINEALTILKEINNTDNKHIKSKIMVSALEGYKGNFNEFNNLLKSTEANHEYVRSIKWIFSLPKLPKIFFNRWDFFDFAISLSENSRPFYEFGVRFGNSFKYLIKIFKKGFGFDTFTGLPKKWHDSMPEGAYSSFGTVPKIKGGQFIVGKFEDTLPNFFSEDRPLASLINFDADLYSSTLCSLNYSDKVIDQKTVLVFDEFIMNRNWEKDEYKALNEFCHNLGYNYEVVAVSFFSKQVAVRLKKLSI
jgi:tetratricopeptide (TPR) repeat protein